MVKWNELYVEVDIRRDMLWLYVVLVRDNVCINVVKPLIPLTHNMLNHVYVLM